MQLTYAFCLRVSLSPCLSIAPPNGDSYRDGGTDSGGDEQGFLEKASFGDVLLNGLLVWILDVGKSPLCHGAIELDPHLPSLIWRHCVECSVDGLEPGGGVEFRHGRLGEPIPQGDTCQDGREYQARSCDSLASAPDGGLIRRNRRTHGQMAELAEGWHVELCPAGWAVNLSARLPDFHGRARSTSTSEQVSRHDRSAFSRPNWREK